MYKFSRKSREKLNQCDERIQHVMDEVIKTVDCTIVTGHRDEETQNEMFRTGKSKLKYPQGKHNATPSLAIDVAPYPVDWKDRERFTLFAGFVIGIAKQFNVNLRWGGDWDMDWQVKDNNFDDLIHFEIRE